MYQIVQGRCPDPVAAETMAGDRSGRLDAPGRRYGEKPVLRAGLRCCADEVGDVVCQDREPTGLEPALPAVCERLLAHWALVPGAFAAVCANEEWAKLAFAVHSLVERFKVTLP